MHSMPDAIVLCGGAGVRLKSVTGDLPKVMAHIVNRPFLELLLKQLRRNRFERVILAVGYRKEAISSYFKDRAFGMNLVYSDESFPLGTGGALRNVVSLVRSDSVLVMNGDSYTNADLPGFVIEHQKSNADITLLVVDPKGRKDAGAVIVDQYRHVTKFAEKDYSAEAPYASSGIYMLARSLISTIPQGREISLERELFPQWLRTGVAFLASVYSGECIDIGTPERYRNAQIALSDAERQGTASTSV